MIVHDRKNLYPELARRLGFKVEAEIHRHVDRRTGRRATDFFEPTFPISNRRCPKNPQSFTLTIVRTLRNAVKHAIAPTGLPFGVAAGGPSVGKATCDTLWRPSSPSRHAPLPWLPLITSDDPVDIRYPGAGWSPPIRSSTCRNTSLGTATSAS